MSDAYQESILVLTKWKEFKEKSTSSNPEDFAKWLLKASSSPQKIGQHETFIINRVTEMDEKDNVPDLANRGLIGHLLGRMHLFVKNYAKVPFQHIGFSNLEEFRILQIIDRVQNISKSQLSNESLMEFPTVVDILKRLIKQGHVRQLQDLKDKRASCLQITSRGKKLLFSSYQALANLQPNVAGDLSIKEQDTLIDLLMRLNNFHTDFFDKNFIKKKSEKL